MENEEQATQETQPQGEAYVTTLNIKSMDLDPRVCFGKKTPQNPRGITPLCKVFGRAVTLKHGENRRDSSIWTALSGEFTGVNLETGKVYNSGKLFLPQGIQDVVEGPVLEIMRAIEAKHAIQGELNVEFAFQINAKTADNPIGYTYEAINLLPPRTKERKDHLKDFILKGIPMPAESEAPKQLEAPVVQTPTEQTPLQQSNAQHAAAARQRSR